MIINESIREITAGNKRFTLDDLKERALIRTGTKVRMLEGDLPKSPNFLFLGDKWRDLFASFLKRGADIEVFVRNPSKNAIRLFEEFAKRIAFYDFSGITKQDAPEIPLKALQKYHFALFCNPKQLWTESEHDFGKSYMVGCDYHARTNAFSRENAWEKDAEKYGRWLDSIKQRTRRIKE